MSHIRLTVVVSAPNSGEQQNVFYYNISPDLPPSPSLPEGVSFASLVTTLYNPLTIVWDDDVEVVERVVELWDDASESWEAYDQAQIVGLSGNEIGQVTSAQVAGRVSIPVLGSGRSASKFIGGLSESWVANSQLTATAVSQLAAFGGAWATGFLSGQGYLFLPRVFQSKTKTFASLATAAIVDLLLSNQVRRKLGVDI